MFRTSRENWYSFGSTHALPAGRARDRKKKGVTLFRFSEATRRIRTDDLLITNQLLYQLS